MLYKLTHELIDIGSWFGKLELIIGSAAIVIVCMVIYLILFKVVKQFVPERYQLQDLLKKFLFRPGLVVSGTFGLWFVVMWLKPFVFESIFNIARHTILLAIIISTGYVLSCALAFAREVSVIFYKIDHSDNLSARKARTQFRIIEKILNFIIIIGTIAVALITFESVRQVGTTLLASAGLIGIILGFAAQKSISTLVAGIQIAISQPIRIDDVVVVEGEWGRIEELTLTYVVVAIWDKRRLIVPINYFIEKPFENWTRTTAELLATVLLYTDYTVPVEAIREEVTRLLSSSKLWDKKVNLVQVTNATETSIEVRILISADNSERAFNLRCEIRESMITFLQKNYPEALPKTRIEFNPMDQGLKTNHPDMLNWQQT